MRAKIFSAAIAVLAILSIGSGCGGGEPDPLTKSAFVEQGNSICKQADEERETALKEAVKENPGGPSGKAEFNRVVVDVALPPIEKMTEELDELGVPKGDEPQVEAIITRFEVGIERLKSDPRGALTEVPFAHADRLASEYGLTYCAI